MAINFALLLLIFGLSVLLSRVINADKYSLFHLLPFVIIHTPLFIFLMCFIFSDLLFLFSYPYTRKQIPIINGQLYWCIYTFKVSNLTKGYSSGCVISFTPYLGLYIFTHFSFCYTIILLSKYYFLNMLCV